MKLRSHDREMQALLSEVAPVETRCRSLMINLEIDDRFLEEIVCTTDDQGWTLSLKRNPSCWIRTGPICWDNSAAH